MKEYYESKSNREIIGLIETEDGLSQEALNVCLEILKTREVSKRQCINHAKQIYRDKLLEIYEGRGYYSMEPPVCYSYFLNPTQKARITRAAFKEARKLLKDLNEGLPFTHKGTS